MGIIGTIWRAAKPLRMVARAQAGQYAEDKVKSGEWDMSRIRELKQNALTRAQRKERRKEQGLFWRFRDEDRLAGRAASAWERWTNPEVSGNASEAAAPVVLPPNLGRNLPGPGEPGSRRSPAPAAAPQMYWYSNPVFLVAAAAGAYYLLRPKKK